MAAKTYWAWAPITTHNAVSGKTTTIPEGTKVTKKELETDWEALLSSGVVRSRPYPDDVRSFESPRNAILRQAKEAMESASAPFQNTDADEEDEVEGVSVANV